MSSNGKGAPAYIESSYTVPVLAVEVVADILNAEQAGGVVMDDAGPDKLDKAVVRAYFPEGEGLDERLARIRDRLSSVPSLFPGAFGGPVSQPWWTEAFRTVSPEDWENSWKAYYKPLRIGRGLAIVPSWEDYQPREGETVVRLDPGMAFGTGTHASTILCLRALEKLIFPGARVTDVGTGSGILAIAAAALGASRVVALDIDPVAVSVAGENARKNAVQDRLAIFQGEISACESRSADLLLANLIADIIVPIADDLLRVSAPGGKVVVSGIIDREENRVARALRQTGFRIEGIIREEGWVAIVSNAQVLH